MIKSLTRPILDPGGFLLAHAPVTRGFNATAAIGTVLVLPALLVIGASVLKYDIGIPFLYNGLEPLLKYLDSPMILLGGLVLAGLINSSAVIRVRLRKEADQLVGIVSLKTRPWNLLVLGMSILLLAGLLTYLIRENIIAR